ncbi:MAG: hypothetical protein CVV41_05965 [Candidatus Riflebacteria bacterium HGW-Riflebacteria-1]|nr:MAG: hypothetical protein CVV41_05965 [Candidatus Riflebacteria bacterium HGW-Riflebacteria-1]
MNKQRTRNIFQIMLILLSLVVMRQAAAQNISNDELVTLARTAAQGQASEQQKAVLFANNKELNNLAIAGKISSSDYQHNQRIFVEQNDKLIREASTRHGLVVAPAKDSGTYKAGTDTDRQLQNKTGDLTVNQVKSVRGSYNQEVSNYLKAQGIKTSGSENWAQKLTTDIMPSPYDMKPADFKAANSFINASGGLAYTSADAAKIQLEIDGKRVVTPALHEANAYHNEMQKKISLMNKEIQNLNRQRSSAVDADSKENLDIEIRKHTAFMSKYIERDNKVADLINKGSSDTGLVESSYTGTAAGKVRQAQNRDAAVATLNAEAHVGAVNKHLAEAATRRFNAALAGAATANNSVDSAKVMIAANLRSLSPTQQSQAIEDLEIKYSGMGKQVAGELKRMNTDKAAAAKIPATRNTTVCKGLGLVNTVLNLSNQYAEGKGTTEILWNMSIGATIETVNKETADYTAREIERLQVKYLAAGEDPNSLAVKLKIMAEASVKGTFHGSVIGSYDLLKTATRTTAGAALAAADSALFLAGEALDTHNVLETTYAEMKAQGMEQSVQNARALKFGKDGLAELRRLADQAAYLRSLLEQNIRSARLSCRDCDNTIDNLKSELVDINNLKGADALRELPGTEKKMTSTLVDSAKAAKTMTAQAEAARKALAGGGSAKEAMQTVAALTASYNQHNTSVEQCKNEMFKIGELASLQSAGDILASFEAEKARLLEQGSLAAANAAIMRDNEAQFKKTIASFDSLQERVRTADTFFAGKREANEAEWLIIKSRLGGIARPEASLPEDFFGEVGTLERLPDKVRREAAQLKPEADSVAGLAEAGNLADAALQRLTPLYNDAGRALTTLKSAIDSLRAAAGQKPAAKPPVATKPAQPAKPAAKPAPQPSTAQPKKNDGRLPCGHLPGQCPTSGIQSVKCRLHSGKISER